MVLHKSEERADKQVRAHILYTFIIQIAMIDNSSPDLQVNAIFGN